MTESDPLDRPDPFTAALTAELGRRTGVCWLRYGGREQAVWHVWLEDSLYVVSGGREQPLPGIEDVETMEVVMRSKESGGRLLTWTGRVSTVAPTEELWEPATTALLADRLNLDDLSAAAQEWAAHSRVTRITPTGATPERPGSLGDDAHLAPPPPTPATTRRPLPRVLHRRLRRRPRLS